MHKETESNLDAMKIGRQCACCSHSFKDAAQLPQWALACLCSTSVSLLPSFPSPPPQHSLVKTRLPGPFHQVGAQSLCVYCGGGGGGRAPAEGAWRAHAPHGPQSILLPSDVSHAFIMRCSTSRGFLIPYCTPAPGR